MNLEINTDQIKNHWELAVSGCVVLILLCIVAFYLWNGSTKEQTTMIGNGAIEYTSAISPEAFDFMKPAKQECGNPFKLKIEAPAAPKPQPAPAKTAAAPKPVVVPTPAPVQTQPAPPPKTQFIPAKLTFQMKGKNTSAKTMAVIQFVYGDNQTEAFRVGIGEEKLGCKILNITDEAISIQDAKGNKGNIPIKGHKKVMINNP